MMRFLLPALLLSFPIAAQLSGVVQSFQSPLYRQIISVKATTDNQTVLAADAAGHLLQWRINDGSIASILRMDVEGVRKIALSGNNTWLAASLNNRNIAVWELHTGKKIIQLPAGKHPVLCFNRENFLLYADGTSLYKTQIADSGKSQLLFQTQKEILFATDVEAGAYCALGTADSLFLLDAVSGKTIAKTTVCPGVVSVQSRSNQICCVCTNNVMQLFELKGKTLQKKDEITVPVTAITQAILLPEYNNVLFAGNTGEIQIWDWASNKLFDTEGIPEPVTALETAGESLLTGNQNGEVFLCKIPFKQGEIETHPDKAPSTATEKSLNERQVRFLEPVEVQLQQLDVYVWDDENIDGDTISLSLNGEWVLENYMVTKEKKKLTLPLVPEKKNTLILYAENLGAAPPNTAVISFNDGNKERTLTLNSDLKRCDAVQFILKK